MHLLPLCYLFYFFSSPLSFHAKQTDHTHTHTYSLCHGEGPFFLPTADEQANSANATGVKTNTGVGLGAQGAHRAPALTQHGSATSPAKGRHKESSNRTSQKAACSANPSSACWVSGESLGRHEAQDPLEIRAAGSCRPREAPGLPASPHMCV